MHRLFSLRCRKRYYVVNHAYAKCFTIYNLFLLKHAFTSVFTYTSIISQTAFFFKNILSGIYFFIFLVIEIWSDACILILYFVNGGTLAVWQSPVTYAFIIPWPSGSKCRLKQSLSSAKNQNALFTFVTCSMLCCLNEYFLRSLLFDAACNSHTARHKSSVCHR